MAELNVTVIRADTNQHYDVDLPDDVECVALLRELVQSMGLPRIGPDDEVVAYELSNKRTGEVLREGMTLAARGTKSGDVLLLTSTFVAGLTAPRVGDRWRRLSDDRVLEIEALSPTYASGAWIEQRSGPDDSPTVVAECAGGVLLRSLADPGRFKYAGGRS